MPLSESDQTKAAVHQLAIGSAYALSHPGLLRAENEDAILIDERLDLVAVADGMGGHADGKQASHDALQALCHFIRTLPDEEDITVPVALRLQQSSPVTGVSPERLRSLATRLFNAVISTNQQLYAHNQARGYALGTGMGTTLSGLWFHRPSRLLLGFHVGDSRVYRLRAGHLQQLTRDHTLYQQMLEQGSQAPLPSRNLLLQAIGPFPSVVPDILHCELLPGDVFLCCTDGLYVDVPPTELAALMSQQATATLPEGCQALITLALRYGGRDNLSALLVRYQALCR